MGKKANQEELPGLERRDVPEIERAADRYRRIRDERCELSKQEAEAKSALIQVMKNKGRQFYSYNGLNVQLSNQENVKVKARDEDEEEPVRTFTQRSRHPKIDTSPASEFIDEIDAEEKAQLEAGEEERERLHKEAVATWRRERPASTEGEPEPRKCECGDYDYEHAPNGDCTITACDCKEFKEDYSAAYPDDEIEAKTDDFTAPRCDECGRIDGGHAPTCSQSDTLTYDDYFRYSQAHDKDHYASHARKMDLKRDPKVDAKVREWKRQQQAGSGVEAEPEKKSKRAKLSPVEVA